MGYDLKVERVLDASIEAVFHARTDPDVQRLLNAHPISRASADLRVGGTACLEWGPSEDSLCRVTQVYREIERPRRLAYTEVLESPASPVYESVITETFEERDGRTLLAFHHQGFPTADERDLHRRGYHIILDRLEKYFAATSGTRSER